MNKKIVDILPLYNRHFVGLWLNFSYQGTKRDILYSSFIVEVTGRWYLYTAGHCLKSLTKFLSSQPEHQSRLIDSPVTDKGRGFQDVEHPFLLEPDKWVWKDDDDHDFGIIPLRPATARLLQAQSKKPLPPSSAALPNPSGEFCLVGIPGDTVQEIESGVRFDVRFLQMSYCSSPPAAFTGKPCETFYGKITGRISSEESIVGMSGGPIFGLDSNSSNEDTPYNIVATQGSWIESQRTVSATLVKPVLDIIENLVP